MTLLDKAAAEQAIRHGRLLFHSMLAMKDVKRGDLHVIVASRLLHTENGVLYGTFEIVAEDSFGDVEAWEHDYAKFANDKAAITARTGLSTREAQLMRPWRLEEDDVLYYGSWIEDDIIVACSGVQPWMDEVIAKCVMAVLKGLMQSRIEELKANAKGNYYDS